MNKINLKIFLAIREVTYPHHSVIISKLFVYVREDLKPIHCS